jgi:ABC-type sulfate/molybdate transport systems ATPase subunit
MLALVEATHLAGRAPFQLSAGERRRIALAAALAARPDVLLYDDPTAALDLPTPTWLGALLVDLSTSPGLTLVVATHDPALLDVVADRCVALGPDRTVVGDGRPDDVLREQAAVLDEDMLEAYAARRAAVEP